MSEDELSNLKNQLFDIRLKQELYVRQYGKTSEIYEKLIKNLRRRIADIIVLEREEGKRRK